MERLRKFSREELFLATKQTLLKYGYEGFTFTLLADRLKVARGTLYRYFENKEELITTYMVTEMEDFLTDLKLIKNYQGFEAQFDFLLEIIFKNSDIHQILGFSYQIPNSVNETVVDNKIKLEQQHQNMYKYLQNFVDLGKEENILKSTLLDSLILGFIFQSVAIPNHNRIPHKDWIRSIKEIISHGMFTD